MFAGLIGAQQKIVQMDLERLAAPRSESDFDHGKAVVEIRAEDLFQLLGIESCAGDLQQCRSTASPEGSFLSFASAARPIAADNQNGFA